VVEVVEALLLLEKMVVQAVVEVMVKVQEDLELLVKATLVELVHLAIVAQAVVVLVLLAQQIQQIILLVLAATELHPLSPVLR
jgi:hypothetical protein